MKKYLIFDLDGTLIKSNHNLIELVSNFMCKKYDLDKESLQYFFHNTRWVALREQIKTFMKVDEKKAEKIANEIYELIQKDKSCVFFDGVPEKIKELSEKYKLYLSTGNSTAFATKKLKEAGIFELFEYVLWSERIMKWSEHIKIFEEQVWESLWENCVFIWDGQKDREIAHIHNMSFIHIDEKLENTYDDIYEIPSVRDIDIILGKINLQM